MKITCLDESLNLDRWKLESRKENAESPGASVREDTLSETNASIIWTNPLENCLVASLYSSGGPESELLYQTVFLQSAFCTHKIQNSHLLSSRICMGSFSVVIRLLPSVVESTPNCTCLSSRSPQQEISTKSPRTPEREVEVFHQRGRLIYEFTFVGLFNV